MSDERSTSNARVVAGLFGEFLREAAVLVAVFAPLDRILQGTALTLRFVVVTMGAIVLLMAGGILLELKRQ